MANEVQVAGNPIGDVWDQTIRGRSGAYTTLSDNQKGAVDRALERYDAARESGNKKDAIAALKEIKTIYTDQQANLSNDPEKLQECKNIVNGCNTGIAAVGQGRFPQIKVEAAPESPVTIASLGSAVKSDGKAADEVQVAGNWAGDRWDTIIRGRTDAYTTLSDNQKGAVDRALARYDDARERGNKKDAIAALNDIKTIYTDQQASLSNNPVALQQCKDIVNACNTGISAVGKGRFPQVKVEATPESPILTASTDSLSTSGNKSQENEASNKGKGWFPVPSWDDLMKGIDWLLNGNNSEVYKGMSDSRKGAVDRAIQSIKDAGTTNNVKQAAAGYDTLSQLYKQEASRLTGTLAEEATKQSERFAKTAKQLRNGEITIDPSPSKANDKGSEMSSAYTQAYETARGASTGNSFKDDVNAYKKMINNSNRDSIMENGSNAKLLEGNEKTEYLKSVQSQAERELSVSSEKTLTGAGIGMG
jgi:alpha-acetolactate decarboxylase